MKKRNAVRRRELVVFPEAEAREFATSSGARGFFVDFAGENADFPECVDGLKARFRFFSAIFAPISAKERIMVSGRRDFARSTR